MNTKEYLKIIGTNLRKYRAINKFSQEKLAESAELSQQFICNVENEKANPSAITIIKLCKALNITPNDLLLF